MIGGQVNRVNAGNCGGLPEAAQEQVDAGPAQARPDQVHTVIAHDPPPVELPATPGPTDARESGCGQAVVDDGQRAGRYLLVEPGPGDAHRQNVDLGQFGVVAHGAGLLGRASRPLRRRPAASTIHETTDPEVIVAEFEYQGTAAETGEEFALPGVFVMRVRDGEIVSSRDYVDHLTAARIRRADSSR
jgi:hypothetical protein